MVTNLILIRHGQGRHQTDNFVGGWTDTELTELGKLQAENVAYRLGKILEGEVKIVSSDIKRAAQTAEFISRVLMVDIEYDELLREINQGIADGVNREKLLEVKAPKTNPILDWRPYEKAETWREFDHRIQKFMRKLDMYSENTLVIVAHSQTIVSIIHNWLDFDDAQKSVTDIRIDNCSLTILSKLPDSTKLIRTLNDISHFNTEDTILSKEHVIMNSRFR